MPKNIVIFSDGTGQEGGVGNNTNVYKLFNMIVDRSPEQIAFYDRGLGTGWRKLTGNVGGGGISKNIRECYEFLFENYVSGDRIFLFGFSRGATTMRSLSSFIHHFGMLPKSRPELIKKAYKIYKTADHEERHRKAKAFVKAHHTMWVRIKFLGVWDTVAALGLPYKSIDVLIDKMPWWRHSYHNFTLSESVEHACHALAIDDERLTFHPVLFDLECKRYQTVRQVWFPGMHTDVGGGYAEQDLSDVALNWMVANAERHGLLIYPDHKIKISADANGMMHDSRGEGMTKLYRRQQRSWNCETHGTPIVHKCVVERTLNQKNLAEPPYHPWILDQDCEVES